EPESLLLIDARAIGSCISLFAPCSLTAIVASIRFAPCWLPSDPNIRLRVDVHAAGLGNGRWDNVSPDLELVVGDGRPGDQGQTEAVEDNRRDGLLEPIEHRVDRLQRDALDDRLERANVFDDDVVDVE